MGKAESVMKVCRYRIQQRGSALKRKLSKSPDRWRSQLDLSWADRMTNPSLVKYKSPKLGHSSLRWEQQVVGPVELEPGCGLFRGFWESEAKQMTETSLAGRNGTPEAAL